MRFALALSAVFVIGTICAGSISYALLTRELTSRLEADVRSMAESLARVAADGDRQDLIEQVRAQAASSRNLSTLVALFAKNGDAEGNFTPTPVFTGARRLITGQDLVLSANTTEDTPEAYLAYGMATELGTVIAARDEAWVADGGEVLIQTTAWGLGVAMLLSIGLAIAIAHRNERRVRAMEEVLDSVGAGSVGLRIRDAGSDDLSRLAGQVDTTLDRLEAGIAAIRQVSTDVAHDLRAPLSRLRLRLEPLALDHGLGKERRDAVGTALSEIDDIAATFDAILRLSRLQSGTVERTLVPVDLGQLVSDVHELLEPTAEDTGHSLVLELPAQPVTIEADRELLAQAVINLVDNALRHCPSPARIVLSAGRVEGRGFIAVADDGPGIASEDRQRATERFVRLDGSRRTPGTGLGLSLVAAIAELHGTTLRLEDNAPGLRALLIF